MKSIDRNVLQSDIKAAIDALNKHDNIKESHSKAAYLSGFLMREYPEIAALLSYIAGIKPAS